MRNRTERKKERRKKERALDDNVWVAESIPVALVFRVGWKGNAIVSKEKGSFLGRVSRKEGFA